MLIVQNTLRILSERLFKLTKLLYKNGMKSKKWIFLLVILIFLTPLCVDAGWRYVSPMPIARYGHDATLGPNGKIYVMGGLVWYRYDGMYSCVVYDPKSDVWEYMEPVPGATIIKQGHFMIFDPERGIYRTVRKVRGKENYFEIYSWPSGKKSPIWTPMTRQIKPEELRKTGVSRQGDGAAVVTGKDGRIYWLGGSGIRNGGGESIVFPYDPIKKKWPDSTTKRVYFGHPGAYTDKTIYKTGIPDMLEHRIDHEAVVTSDSKIYVMGGRRKKMIEERKNNWVPIGKVEIANSVECYDPGTNKWEYRKPMPLKRFLFSAVVGPDDRIYTFGGRGEYDPKTKLVATFDDTHVYDPGTDTWSSLNPMPGPGEAHAGVLGANGKIYIMGGGRGYKRPPLRDVLIYDPVKGTWEKGPKMKLPRDSLAAVATPDGKIYAIGGTDVGAYKKREALNELLPRKKEVYTGKVQDTVEVLDISK